MSESSVRKAKDNEAASPAANKPRNNAEAGWQRHEGAREQPIAIGNDAGVPSTRNEDIGSAGAVRAGDIGNTKSGGGNDGHVGTSERDEELPQQDGDEEEDNDLAVGPGVAAAGIVWNAYSRGTWINGQWIPKVMKIFYSNVCVGAFEVLNMDRMKSSFLFGVYMYGMNS